MRHADRRPTTPATASVCLVAAAAVLLMGAANLSSLAASTAPAAAEVHETVGQAVPDEIAAVDGLGAAIRTAAAGFVLMLVATGLSTPAATPRRWHRGLALVPASPAFRRAPSGFRAPPA